MPKPYLQPWLAALLLAFIGALSYLLTGMPMGITTAYSKLGATLLSLPAPDSVASLGYFQAVSLDYTPPLTQQAVQGGAGPNLDGIAAIQYPLVFGIVMGAALSAFLLGALQLYWKQPIHQYLAVFCGGVTLGLAARMTPACNVWHSHMNDSPDAGHIIELDIRGQICPSSLLMALKKVNEHAARIRNKEVRLCILTDNRQATASIPKAAGNMGHKVTVEKHNGYYEVRSGEPDPPR